MEGSKTEHFHRMQDIQGNDAARDTSTKLPVGVVGYPGARNHQIQIKYKVPRMSINGPFE